MEQEKIDASQGGLDPLVTLVESLRGENGCPWDKKQNARSMALYLLEETHELVEAVAEGNSQAICEELGDVLFHIVFLARLFQERGDFNIRDVISLNHRKMVRRHPHVFGDRVVRDAEDVKKQWHEIKKTERKPIEATSVLDAVPVGLPALMRAYRISQRAASNGFDWEEMTGVLQKAEEEWAELKNELKKADGIKKNRSAITEEFGDLLFTLVNVARFAGIHPETAMTEAVAKFKKRFTHMEQVIRASNREISEVAQDEKDALWESAKASIGQ